ncbi:MAG: 7TM domain-containing protein [Patescibacteria group bacterium]|nr:7TM domain-containing protein [Patescibacteria group bacterium]
MSEIINLILSQGLDIETVYLILALPFIATLIAVLRQIIGVRSFGVYTPLVLTFAFWAVGIRYGLAIFIVILVSGTVMRYFLKNFRLLYLPRIAIVLTVISVAILALLALAGYFGKFALASTSILPILIMITLIEKFISTQVEKGIRTATILSIETIIISSAGYYLIVWDNFKNLILDHPEYIILLFIINIILGRWTGLRLREYFRFKDVIKHVDSN